jgi:uncharacterized protein YdaU (DUF1376 family)
VKTQEFIRLRRAAAENGWSVEQEVDADNRMAAVFTKPVSEDVVRKLRIFFELDEDNTVVKGCYYNDREIRMGQVRNLLENL